MTRALGALAWLLRASIVLAAAVMLGSIFLQVVMRYVFHRAPPWSEELALLMFSWATLGGLALGVREGFHVALTLLPERLSPALRRGWGRVLALATAALGGFVAWSGLRFVEMTGGSISAAIGYPTEILTAMAPVSGALVMVFALEQALRPGPVEAP